MKDELYHYGVAGMKWGQRRGPSKITLQKKKKEKDKKVEKHPTTYYMGRRMSKRKAKVLQTMNTAAPIVGASLAYLAYRRSIK